MPGQVGQRHTRAVERGASRGGKSESAEAARVGTEGRRGRSGRSRREPKGAEGARAERCGRRGRAARRSAPWRRRGGGGARAEPSPSPSPRSGGGRRPFLRERAAGDQVTWILVTPVPVPRRPLLPAAATPCRARPLRSCGPGLGPAACQRGPPPLGASGRWLRFQPRPGSFSRGLPGPVGAPRSPFCCLAAPERPCGCPGSGAVSLPGQGREVPAAFPAAPGQACTGPGGRPLK